MFVRHGDRAAVGVDIDAQGSSLREHKTHFPLNARVEYRAFVSERIPVGLRWHAGEAVVYLGCPMSLTEKKTHKFTVKAPRSVRDSVIKDVPLISLYSAWCLVTLARAAISWRLSRRQGG